mgnify:FL=1
MLIPGFIYDAVANFVRALPGYGLKLYGSSSGSVGIKPLPDAGSLNYTAPSAPTEEAMRLTSGITGVLTWTPATVVTRRVIAGETISALKPVVIIDDVAYVANANNSAHKGFFAGIAITTATTGNNIEIQTAGRLQDASWSWDISAANLFVGAGQLTQTPPTTGWLQVAARVETDDSVFVGIRNLIVRL